MSVSAIVSYDGTPNDDDALALARVLAGAGAELTLAYVRHDPAAPDAAWAQELLMRGVAALGDTAAQTRVVVNPSTSEGLRELAASEQAQLVIFGSDYRTACGRIAPQRSTQALLDGGSTAIAIAPAGYRAREIETIGLLAELDDHASIDTAHALTQHFQATVTDRNYNVDLLIVGSRPEAQVGRTLISAQAENALVGTAAPVLVVARGVALDFHSPIYIA